MIIKPNFFIVGAPKCGTTALSEYLRLHPNVYMSRPKEPHYFASDFDNHRLIKERDSYERLFKHIKQHHLAIGEASVWYLYSSVAAKNIYKYNKEANIIILLRKQTDMLQSLHSQLIYSQYEDQISFKKAWQLQHERMKQKRLPKRCNQPEFLQYKKVGLFGDQVRRILSIFPEKQVKIIFFEDFIKDTRNIYLQILNFLELEDDKRCLFPIINERKKFKYKFIQKVINHFPITLKTILLYPFDITGIQRESVTNYLRKITSTTALKETLDLSFKKEIIFEFTRDINLLEHITNRPLINWKKFK